MIGLEPGAESAQERWSTARMVVTAIVGAISLYLAISAGMNALGNVLSAANAPNTLAFDASNPTGRALQSTLMAQEAVAKGRRTLLIDARAAAIEGLRRQLLHAPSLRALAYAEAALGNEDAAWQQLNLAERVSRRELGVQLALIERCVARDDISCALSHYDVALSTHRAAGELLVERLMNALDEPVVRAAIAPYLRESRPWARDFLHYSGVNAKTVVPLAEALIAAAPLPAKVLEADTRKNVFGRLAIDRQVDVARRLYLSLRGDPSVFRRVDFAPQVTEPNSGPVTWQALAADSYAVAFEGDGGRQMTVTASSGSGQVVARKLLLLPAQRYRFSQVSSTVHLRGGSSAVWVMHCLSDSALSPLMTMPVATKADSVFEVPALCGAQMLELVVTVGGDPEGISLVIDRLDLTPLSRSTEAGHKQYSHELV